MQSQMELVEQIFQIVFPFVLKSDCGEGRMRGEVEIKSTNGCRLVCSSGRGEQPNQNKTKQDRFVAVTNFQERFKVRLVIRLGGGGEEDEKI